MKLVVVGPVHFERVTTVAGTIITLLFRLSRNGRQFTRRITTKSGMGTASVMPRIGWLE